MKIFTFIVFLGILLGIEGDVPKKDEEMLKIFVQAHKDCAKENNLTGEDIQKIVLHDLVNPSQNMKCYYKCFAEKMDKSPKIDGLEQYKLLFVECKNGKTIDDCETAFKVAVCVEEKYKQL